MRPGKNDEVTEIEFDDISVVRKKQYLTKEEAESVISNNKA